MKLLLCLSLILIILVLITRSVVYCQQSISSSFGMEESDDNESDEENNEVNSEDSSLTQFTEENPRPPILIRNNNGEYIPIAPDLLERLARNSDSDVTSASHYHNILRQIEGMPRTNEQILTAAREYHDNFLHQINAGTNRANLAERVLRTGTMVFFEGYFIPTCEEILTENVESVTLSSIIQRYIVANFCNILAFQTMRAGTYLIREFGIGKPCTRCGAQSGAPYGRFTYFAI